MFPEQSYLYITCLKGDEMMTTQSMTKEASSVLCQINQNPITLVELTKLTGFSEPYCGLVLTQMEMAGLVAKEEGCFIRCQ